MNRRDLIKGAIATGGLAAAGSLSKTALSAEQIQKMSSVLGRTGEKVSKLGIGCGQFGRVDEVTPDKVRAMLERALELGVNYVDAAPNYGEAEAKLGPAMEGIRDRLFLVTKTEEASYDGTMRLLEQSLKKMKTDRVDLVHLHNIGLESRFPDLEETLGPKGALGALRKARSEGLVRYIGASGHLYPSRFHKVLDTGEIDVVMNAVNFISQHVYDFEDKVWSRAREENIALVAMKVLGGGGRGDTKYKIPEEYYERAVRYALSLPGLAVAVIGLENIAEIEQAVETILKTDPLSEAERIALSGEGLKMAATDSWKTAYGLPLT